MFEPADGDLVRARLVESSAAMSEAVAACADDLVRAAEVVSSALASGAKIVAFGNGGSAAQAQHLVAEVVGRFRRERAPMPAIALYDAAVSTALANDYDYEAVFARHLAAVARAGDVAIAFSCSGRSRNVVTAVRAARRLSVTTIGMLGGDGGDVAPLVDVAVIAPSDATERIQEVHCTLSHALCELVERDWAPVDGTGDAARGVVALDDLLAARDRWRAEGKTVVWTNGCFDLLHVGHVRVLREAKALGDVLVVGVNSDDSVRALKGPGRPITPAAERAEIVAAVDAVDHVVVFDEPTPEPVLVRLRPDVHCKGGDYRDVAALPEARAVEEYGGRVVVLSLVPDRSTTAIVARLREGTGTERPR